MEDVTYLWVAETVLRNHRRPLSARELVNYGLEDGLFPSTGLRSILQRTHPAVARTVDWIMLALCVLSDPRPPSITVAASLALIDQAILIFLAHSAGPTSRLSEP